jgi:hypothetical protein
MTIRRKPRKHAINEFVSMLVPDQVENAFERVDDYFSNSLELSFESPDGVAGVLSELIHTHGEPVRAALYGLLCEEKSAMREVAGGALLSGGIKAAVGVLMPVLGSRFALPPGVGFLVSTLVVKALSAGGEKALCEALSQQHRKGMRQKRTNEARREGSRKAARRDTEVQRSRRAVVKRRTKDGKDKEKST